MLRILKSALALTLILALAACNITAPTANDDRTIAKQEIETDDNSGGSNPPAGGGEFPDYGDHEEEAQDVQGGGRPRGQEIR